MQFPLLVQAPLIIFHPTLSQLAVCQCMAPAFLINPKNLFQLWHIQTEGKWTLIGIMDAFQLVLDLILLLANFSRTIIVISQCLHHVSSIILMWFHPWEHLWSHQGSSLIRNMHFVHIKHSAFQHHKSTCFVNHPPKNPATLTHCFKWHNPMVRHWRCSKFSNSSQKWVPSFPNFPNCPASKPVIA